MRKFRHIIYSLLLLLVVLSCEKDKDIDTEKPQIDNSFSDAFPTNCDTIYFGESFDLKILLTDNIELGSYSISIHNNFDHHSHSTEVTECSIEPIKDPVNPFLSIEDYTIPTGLSKFTTSISISIPSNNGNGIYDEGDYHFFISLTDNEGWSAQKGLSVKMFHR